MLAKPKPVLFLLFMSGLLLVWATRVGAGQTIGTMEQHIFYPINGWPDILRWPFLLITYTGSIYMMASLVLYLIWRGYPRLALRIFAGGCVVFLLTLVMKMLVHRPRPFVLLANIQVRERLVAGYGFPSTHTAMATVMALLLVIWLPHKWRWLAVAWIILVGISRMYLGVHAPLDIVGGFVAGVFVVCLSLLVHNKLKFVRNITHMKLSD